MYKDCGGRGAVWMEAVVGGNSVARQTPELLSPPEWAGPAISLGRPPFLSGPEQ
jgi:hypothetical protein